MPDENPTRVPADHLDAIERDVLYLLTGLRGEQPVWSLDDLSRDMRDTDSTEIAVIGLYRAGLIHKTSDGFVFATRAGVRMVQLVGHAV
jgi:hypothetical protein